MATLFEAVGGVIGSLQPSTTWAAPNGLFPTTNRNDSSAYVWTSSSSTITLPSSGLADGYVFLWGYEFEDSSNGRMNPQGRMVQASGTGTFASSATGGYNRDNSEDRSYVSGWSFVDNPSALATFQFQWRRDNDSPGATDGTVRSFLQVIPLYYSDVGVYTSTSTTSTGGTTPSQITGLTGTDGTNVTISSNTVSVTGDNKRYLCLGGAYHQGLGGTRTQRWYGLRVDGTKDDAAKGCMYYRSGNNDDGGESFIRLLETDTATRTVDLFQYRGDGVGAGQGGADQQGSTTGSNSQHALVVIELNDSAEVFSSVDSTGGQEFALTGPVDVDIASTADIEFNDSASFTRSTDTGVNIETDMDVFVFANVSHAREASSIGSGSRWTVHGEFTVNGTEQTAVGFHGNYNRGNQSSADCMGSSCNQAGFFAVTTGQDIGVSNQELSGTEGGGGDIETQPGWVGFGLVNLDTLEPTGGETASGAPSLAIPTSSGTAEVVKTSSGVPTTPHITSSGSAKLEFTASGSPSLSVPTSTGDAQAIKTSSGSPSLPGLIASGAAEVANTASGNPSLSLPTAIGAAQVTRIASGSPVTTVPTSSGTASVQGATTASGAPSLSLITASGTAEVVNSATGAPDLPAISASGTAEVQKTSSGSPSVPVITASGIAEVGNQASGSPSIALPTSLGVATVGRIASGGPVTPAITVSGAAVTGRVATGIPALPVVTASGVAEASNTASGSPSLPVVTSSGVSVAGRTSSGLPILPLVTSSGLASVAGQTVSNGAPDTPIPIASGAASLTRKASGSPSLAVVQSSGAAETINTATGVPDLPIPITSGDATTGRKADGSPNLSAITASGASTIGRVSSGAPDFPQITSSGLAAVGSQTVANGSPEVPAVIASGVAIAGRKAVSCTLVTRNGVALPNLTDLSWAWFDEADPGLMGAPTDKGESEITDGSGVISVELPNTSLPFGQVGTLVLRSDDEALFGAYNLAVGL